MLHPSERTIQPLYEILTGMVQLYPIVSMYINTHVLKTKFDS